MCTTRYVHYTICALHDMCTTICALHDISSNKLRFGHTRSLALLDQALALKKKNIKTARTPCVHLVRDAKICFLI